MREMTVQEKIQAISDEFIRAGLPPISPFESEDLKDRIEENSKLEKIMMDPVGSLEKGQFMYDKEIELVVQSGKNGYLEFIAKGGKGKTEGAISTMLKIEAEMLLEKMDPEFAFSRHYAESNTLLAKAQASGTTLILNQDEDDDLVGLSSATEENALFTNMDGMRVLRHWMIRCSILSRPRFAVRCRFIAEPIFQDSNNRVNYFILYSPPWSLNEKWYKRPRALIALPLHQDEVLRSQYREWKVSRQVDLTATRGRTAASKKVILPLVQRAVQFAKDDLEGEYESFQDFYDCLFWDIPGGDSLIDQERKIAARRAFKIHRKSEGRDFPRGKSGKTTTPYTGQITNLREAVLQRLAERGVDERHVEALRIRTTQHISQDDIGLKIGVKQATIHTWLKDISRKELGYAFEDIYDMVLWAQGIKHISAGGNEDEPDVVIFGEEGKPIRILSLKCYIDKRDVTSIPSKELAKKEIQMHEDLGIPLDLVFFDMWVNYLHDPARYTGQKTFSFRRPEELR